MTLESSSAMFSQDLELVHLSMIEGLIPAEMIQANPEIKEELESSIFRFREIGGYVEFFSNGAPVAHGIYSFCGS